MFDHHDYVQDLNADDDNNNEGAVDNHDYVQDYNVNGGDDNGNNFCEA